MFNPGDGAGRENGEYPGLLWAESQLFGLRKQDLFGGHTYGRLSGSFPGETRAALSGGATPLQFSGMVDGF